MRIANFVQRYPPALGGSEAYIQRLSRALTAAGHHVDIWTTVARDLSAFWSPQGRCFPVGGEVDAGVAVRRFPLWRMHGRRWLLKPLSLIPLRAWQALTLPCNPISLAMWREAGQSSDAYDAVHATAFPYAWPIVCARRLARRLSVPFYLTPFLHLGDATNAGDKTRRSYTQPALRRLLLAADGVFVQTELERSVAIQLGVESERIVLQGLGVEPSECTGGDRKATRMAWRAGAKDVVIGHLANLSAEKGSIDLVRAAELAAENGARVMVILAGPAMPNAARFLADRVGNLRVVRLGELTEEQKRDFYAGIDVFALPSRSDSFGLVLLEAWANGIPNVAYRAGGPGELIRDGQDGLLSPCGDIESLAGCLARLASNAEYCARLGATGRLRLPGEFAWPRKLDLAINAMTGTTKIGAESKNKKTSGRRPEVRVVRD